MYYPSIWSEGRRNPLKKRQLYNQSVGWQQDPHSPAQKAEMLFSMFNEW